MEHDLVRERAEHSDVRRVRECLEMELQEENESHSAAMRNLQEKYDQACRMQQRAEVEVYIDSISLSIYIYISLSPPSSLDLSSSLPLSSPSPPLVEPCCGSMRVFRHGCASQARRTSSELQALKSEMPELSGLLSLSKENLSQEKQRLTTHQKRLSEFYPSSRPRDPDLSCRLSLADCIR